jgi:hypothetical protein
LSPPRHHSNTDNLTVFFLDAPRVCGLWWPDISGELCADVSVFVSVRSVLPCVVLRIAAKDHSCRGRINTGDFALLRFGALRCGVVRKAFSGRRSTNELPRQQCNPNSLESAQRRVKFRTSSVSITRAKFFVAALGQTFGYGMTAVICEDLTLSAPLEFTAVTT